MSGHPWPLINKLSGAKSSTLQSGRLPSRPVPLDVFTICNYNLSMRYEWNERKREANLRKHGFDFVDAPKVFDGITLSILDDREDYGEERYVTLGLLKNTVVIIVHTEQPDIIRIISMRKATRYEEDNYFAQVGDELEANSGDDGQGH